MAGNSSMEESPSTTQDDSNLCPNVNDCCDGDKLKKRRLIYVHSDAYIQSCDRLPKVPGRAGMVHSLICAYGLFSKMRYVVPTAATESEVTIFHTPEYVEFLKSIDDQEDEEKYDETAQQFGLGYDCPGFPGIYDYSTLVCGATITAARCLLLNKCDVAINWAGGWHHAKKDEAGGFCYLNDIVLGILRLRQKFDRVMYIDLDLHHGDGVEDAFCATSKVLTLSLHKYGSGFFPGTGRVEDIGMSKGRHYTINVPLKDGIQDDNFYRIFEQVASAAFGSFKPQAIVCQCGADGLAGDPMDSFNLSLRALGRCLQYILNWNLPLLLLGGGGYNLPNTARCWTYLTSVALGEELADDIPEHKHFPLYGPDYELHISPGNRPDKNNQEYINDVRKTISENLAEIDSTC